MKKSIIFLLLFEALNAQIEPKDIKSPNAASFERYGKYNVSLSNGTVDVNIPLHQMQLQGGGTLDLNLNFDTSGIKISQPAGSTGVNWSLQIPGMITRSVNGYEDEGGVRLNNGTVMGNHFYHYSELNYPNIETQQGLESFTATRSPSTSNDLQPDIFTFNFMGKTGRFFLGQDGTWKVQSENNLKVIIKEENFFKPFNYTPTIPNGTMNPYEAISIGKITIIDDLGNQYIFGSSQNSIEFTVSNFYNQNKIISTAWYLNEVKDRLGNTLFTCTYQRGKPIANFYNNVNITNFIYELLSGSLISPVYLSSIETKDEELTFSYSDRNDLTYANDSNLAYKFQRLQTNNNTTATDPNWPNRLYHLYTNFNQTSTAQVNPNVYSSWTETCKLLVWNKLDKITVKTNYIINKEINFEYVNQPTERLFLTKVKFSNNTYGQISEYDYKIKYNSGNNTEYLFDGSLSKYLWLGTNIFDSYASYTEPDAHCYIDCGNINNDYLAKKGALLKIIYPTRGFTYFDFEQNMFSKYLQLYSNVYNNEFIIQNSSNRKTAGLRIKKIVNFPDVNSINREIISYKYSLSDNYYSSGILSVDANLTSIAQDLPWFANFYNAVNGVKFSYNGSPITYSRVVEERENEDGTQKTEYLFTNYDTASYYNDKPYIVRIPTVASNYNAKYIDKSFLRGKLLEKNIYDVNSNLLKYTSYIYNFNNMEDRYIKSFKFGEVPSDLIKIYYGDIYLEKEIVREYFNGKEIKTEITYNKNDYPYQNLGTPIYTGYQRLNQTSVLSSTGDITTNTIDYQFNCTDANGNCHDELFGLPKITKEFNNSILLSLTDLKYKTLNSNPKSLVIDEQKKTLFTLNIDSRKIKYTKYDTFGNPIEFQKEDGNYVSLIMDYSGNKVLAKIENVRYDDLAPYLTNIQKPYLETSQDAANNSVNPILYAHMKDIELRGYVSQMRNELPQSFVTSYTYDSYNRLKTITSPNGFVDFYEYDNLGRLIKIKDSEGKVLKEYQYGYSISNLGNYPYLLEEITNDEYKFAYLKTNCSTGKIGDVYYYTIPPGKYKSLISAADLYDKVLNDAIQNGQNQANTYGNCIDSLGNELTGLSTIQLHTSGLYLNGNTVSGYFVFSPKQTFDGQQGCYIAKLADNLIPSAERNISYHQVSSGIDRYWSFNIKPNGYMFVSVNGTSLQTGESIAISSFQYNKN